jgi:hypothetical protein
VLLGAPLTLAATDRVLLKKLAELKLLCSRALLLDSHDAFFILKNCLSIPRLMYTLRSAPCYESGILHSYDSTIATALSTILNIQLDANSALQCSLPVRYGGLGVRRTEQLSVSAYLASAHGSSALVADILGISATDFLTSSIVNQAKHHWEASASQPSTIVTQTFQQKVWDQPIINKLVDNLIKDAAGTSLGRLLAVSSPHAGDWLNAIPMSPIGLKLSNEHFRCAEALRLGTPIYHPHKCSCGAQADCYGSHGLSCRRSAGRFSRHAQVNEILKRSLASTNVPSQLEPARLSRSDGKRSDGMTFTPWTTGRCLVWDFTCVHTLAGSNMPLCVAGPSKVAEKAEAAKQRKYSTLNQTYIFMPVAIETLGAVGPLSTQLLNKIGRLITTTTGNSQAPSFLWQSIMMAVQRGNAISTLGTLPQAANNFDNFYSV